ncbi:MAG: hypothetical protein WA131_01685 [Desulfitobacteriaceae bacterium]
MFFCLVLGLGSNTKWHKKKYCELVYVDLKELHFAQGKTKGTTRLTLQAPLLSFFSAYQMFEGALIMNRKIKLNSRPAL